MRMLSLLVLALAVLASAGGLRTRKAVKEMERKLEVVANATKGEKKIGVSCEMNYLFNGTMPRRPNSAELDALIAQTKRFFTERIAAKANNNVEMSLTTSNLDLPLQITDTFHLRFYANFYVDRDSALYPKDIVEMVDGLDYSNDYKVNYVWNATPMKPVEKNIFYHTVAVSFTRASGRKKDHTFRNYQSEGSYFDGMAPRASPLREDTHVYNQKLWQQKVRNGGY